MNAFEGKVRLEGERIVLRPFGLDDAATLIEVIRAKEDWLPPNFPTALDAETLAWFLREGVHKVQQYGLGLHLAVTGEDGEIIGTIGLFKVEWSQGTCEVGYGMRPNARGNGYATEALRLVSDWALRDCGLYRVELRALTSNKASIRVAEKARFWREGRARGGERDAEGVNQDMFVFSRIAPDVRDEPSPRLMPVDVGPGDPEMVTVRALRLLHEADAVLVADAPEAPVRAHTTRLRRVDGDPAAAVLDALDDGARTIAFALGDPAAFRDAARGVAAARPDVLIDPPSPGAPHPSADRPSARLVAHDREGRA
ncbi:GNAT family N-acetyltransferase [Actinomadura algeriensis]|uniref:RimJ/RimL family protein N-acetyltransferase n=1 Tax=Actinomadura algeriensis TaxID=1679523 RepID=A0ABR9JID7_9ACTN|nr:GNAT family N-acetyltransferase [Actinomadura algeriensis]MBE1530315.1 RimJ/RimL family protein N-acetyltransferase [Actinomadura algeriensis]